MRGVKGTLGYSDQAAQLQPRYDQASFEDMHALIMHVLPTSPSTVMDIGAGTGRDAAYLAGQGHETVAVEPTDEFRTPASARYPHIEWIDDALPKLEKLEGRIGQFDLIMATAMWMHLNEQERPLAMSTVATLLKPRGLLVLSLRHGPIPEGRLMFDVSAAETIELAKREGFENLVEAVRPSIGEINRKAGITWSHLAFCKVSA
ncbi:MAG: SAM-dependent methyltransferase [Hyphomicrobiales bacterium]|nr:MAG: SAM-dependent methyltransferase [Hyphomicrobiales bacterium]